MYLYRVERGVATLNRGDNAPLKRIGKFKDDSEAKAACLKHYAKACQAAVNLGRAKPDMYWA